VWEEKKEVGGAVGQCWWVKGKPVIARSMSDEALSVFAEECFVALAGIRTLRAFFLAAQSLIDHMLGNASVVIEFHRIGCATLGQ
jgi:hypothetical protein